MAYLLASRWATAHGNSQASTEALSLSLPPSLSQLPPPLPSASNQAYRGSHTIQAKKPAFCINASFVILYLFKQESIDPSSVAQV